MHDSGFYSEPVRSELVERLDSDFRRNDNYYYGMTVIITGMTVINDGMIIILLPEQLYGCGVSLFSHINPILFPTGA